MPSTHKLPARTEHHCEPCEHLKRENMLCSRLHGISCDYVCHHPEANESGPLPSDPEKAARIGELRAKAKEHGRFIGRRDLQPSWCPLRRDPANAALSGAKENL